MPKNLLIVESPAKAKTIEKYLGKDFTVRSSYGHIRDLDKGTQAVDVDNQFKPRYVVSPDKRKVVKELKDWSKKVDEVWLATDEDREGEAISWHLCHVLDLDPESTKRIVFREITKPAIQKAILQPRTVDQDLVDAQQARRILDRLVGYELSETLWKKVRGRLSAGRVQSVAVKLLVEREREINAFVPEPYFKVQGFFNVQNQHRRQVELKADASGRLNDYDSARQLLEDCKGAAYTISNIEVKPLKRRPTAPFTTSTLQQEASRKLGFSVKRTMMVAQKLYEGGFITYMRTDSINLSEVAIAAIAEEVQKQYGEKYVQTRRFKTKKAGAQEAHEAIRPTYIERQQVSEDRDLQRLYELIWKRTIASQMAEAQLEKTTVTIDISTVSDTQLIATGEVIKFDGFLKVYLEGNDDEEEEETKGMLPPLNKGQQLDLNYMQATERFTRGPARYSEASLVKKMEELGIGRPSTYAPTISRIMEPERGYVVKESREGVARSYQVLRLENDQIKEQTDSEVTGTVKNRLFATDIGMTVSDFLDKHFGNVMDYRFTAEMEEALDSIATGKRAWVDLLERFYPAFHAQVQETIDNAERPTGERILGQDPETGRTLLTRMSRNGPVVQIGAPDELDEGEKPRYANLRHGQSMETLTYEDALELFKLPKKVGTYKDQDLIVAVGRYGPYVRWGDTFASLDRGEDPMEVTLARAQQVIEQKLKSDAPVGSYQGKPISKAKGRFGPYLKWNDLYVNIPRRLDPEQLTTEEMHELIAAKVEKEANRYIHQWPDEKISVENGRWGPFIRFKRKNVKIPKIDGERVTAEQAKEYTLEQVKAIIEAELPGSFKVKAKTKKKPAKKEKGKKDK